MNVSVPLQWCKEVKRYVFRFIELQRLYCEMMKELPPDRAAWYELQRRAIDTRIRSLYYGYQGENTNNVTTEEKAKA
jgi:hypothetical protein